MLSPVTATELLTAVRPLTGISASLRDSLLVVLRKALFNKCVSSPILTCRRDMRYSKQHGASACLYMLG
jgi:hypothetical protein